MADNAKPAGVVKWLQWLIVSSVGLTGLALAAAHAPARIRLLLLLSVLFGAIAGWGLALAARQFGLAANGSSLGVVGLLVAAALVGQTLEAWRLYRQTVAKQYQDVAPPTLQTSAIIPSTDKSGKGNGQPEKHSPEADLAMAGKLQELLQDARRARREKQKQESQFLAYQHQRLHGLRTQLRVTSELPDWGAVAFWLFEVLAGAVAAAWVFRRSLRVMP